MVWIQALTTRKTRVVPTPGPDTVPLLGNLHLIPKTNIHYKFTEWAKQYGEIYSVEMGPETAIVITSPAAV
ncbi:hypothetical protein FRC03_012592 [Tulasnella sp. 419]|nr:hypothetical protein FRC03_012592 [Tulasnella sp. 419]